MKGQRILTGLGISILLLVSSVGLAAAQDSGPQNQNLSQPDLAITASVRSRIAYQGILEEGGHRVTGRRDMVFSLYGNQNCTGTAIDTIPKDDLLVTNGYFDTDLDVDHTDFSGQGRWLRVTVEGTTLGCEEILPVPYALSLRPGAQVLGEVSGTSAFGAGNLATSPSSHGITGATWSPVSYGGVFSNNAGGAAIMANGSIKSTADSYVFVPGGQAVIHGATSGATLKYWGGGDVQLVADTRGSKEIVFPVTMPAVLYGQPMRVEQIALTFRHTEFAELSRIWVYRERMNGSYRTILDDSTGWSSVEPFWTTLTFDLSSDNVLSSDDGQIAVRITCGLEATNSIQFTGIRVRLGHD